MWTASRNRQPVYAHATVKKNELGEAGIVGRNKPRERGKRIV